MDREELGKKIKELEEYTDMEGSEIGEACGILIRLYDYSDYVSEEFNKAVGEEVLRQLANFKNNCEIVEDDQECFHCGNGTVKVKTLNWT